MRLYVGNLNYETTEARLREVFVAFGTIKSCYLPIDKESNRPRGFAFVEMSSPAEGEAAIAALDGTSLDGRTVKVNQAHERPEKGSGGGGGRPAFRGNKNGGGEREQRGGGRGHRGGRSSYED